MKRTVCILMSLLLCMALLSGCGSQQSGASGITGTGESIVLNISNARAFATYDTTAKNYQYDNEARDAWRQYMADRYRITINITNYADSSPGLLQDINAGQYDGFALASSDFIYAMKNAGSILSLTPYLEKNKAWKALPEEFRKQFEINGEIWAIPYAMTEPVPIAGGIRKSWLTAAGQQAPTDLTQFASVVKSFNKTDCNGDGIVGNDYAYYGLTSYNLSQVFHSFGVYVAPNGSSPYNYDPELGCIADAFFKPNAEAALTYIKDLYASGAIAPTGYSKSENASTEFGISPQQATDEYVLTPPLSADHPTTAYRQGVGYVLTATSKDPQKLVNAFVDLLFSSSASALDCLLGMPENYVDVSGGVYVVEGYASGSCKTMPNLGGYPKFVVNKDFYIASSKEGAQQSVIAAATQVSTNRAAYIQRYQKTDQLVMLPFYYSPLSADYYLMQRTLLIPYNRLLGALRDPDCNVAEELRIYREKALDTGIDTILQNENRLLGLPNAQTFAIN